MNIQELIKIVKNCFGIKYVSEDYSSYLFSSKATLDGAWKDMQSVLSKKALEEIIQKYDGLEKGVNSITSVGYFECLVKNELFDGIEGTRISTPVDEYGTDFAIGDPSIELLLYALQSLSKGVGRSAANSFPNTMRLNSQFGLCDNTRPESYDTQSYIGCFT